MRSHIGGLRKGDRVTFSTFGEERSVSGIVTALSFGGYQGDYCDITLDADGMNYTFGTGGHLGSSWTTESGGQEWFVVSKEN
jgi:hypothetical protein